MNWPKATAIIAFAICGTVLVVTRHDWWAIVPVLGSLALLT